MTALMTYWLASLSRILFNALLQHRKYKIFTYMNGKEKVYMMNKLNN